MTQRGPRNTSDRSGGEEAQREARREAPPTGCNVQSRLQDLGQGGGHRSFILWGPALISNTHNSHSVHKQQFGAFIVKSLFCFFFTINDPIGSLIYFDFVLIWRKLLFPLCCLQTKSRRTAARFAGKKWVKRDRTSVPAGSGDM